MIKTKLGINPRIFEVTVIIIFICLLIIPFLELVLSPFSMSASISASAQSDVQSTPGIATVTVTIEEDRMGVNVAPPDATGVLNIRGEVSVALHNIPRKIIVSIKKVIESTGESTSGSNGGWSAELSPRDLVFEESGKQYFTLTVTAPVGTSAEDSRLIKVEGTWHYDGDNTLHNVNPDQIMVSADQYYSIEVTPSDRYKEAQLSESAIYDLKINNMGNGEDKIDLKLKLEDELSRDLWEAEINYPTLELDRGESKVVTLTIKSPPQPPRTDHTVNLLVKSEKNSDKAINYPIHLHIEGDKVIICGGTRPILIMTTSLTNIGTINTGESKNITVKVTSLISAVDKVYLTIVRDTDAELTVEPEYLSLDAWETGTFNIRITVPLPNDNTQERKSDEIGATIIIRAEGGSTKSNPKTIIFVIVRTPGQTRSSWAFFEALSPVETAALTMSVAFGIAGALFIGGTEVGRYKFLMLLVPLYTKIHKEKILDHFTRGRIYEHLRSHPGAHFGAIKKELELHNGGLAYHLRALEREELIKSVQNGRYRLFFLRDVKTPKKLGHVLSTLQKRILETIHEHPGISQTDVGSMIVDKKQRTISYHIKNMARKGLIRLEKSGKNTECFLS